MRCESEGCERVAERRGLCGLHYARQRRAGLLPKSKRCQAKDCSKPAVGHGLCPNHYEKWRRCGDPGGRKNWGQGTTHPLYPTWRGMRVRTGVVKGGDENAKKYIEAGIIMCERWRDDFWAFVEDIGPKPTPTHSVDRIDNSKGYSPSNCRWATKTEQLANRSITKLTEFLVRDLRKRHDQGESALSLSKEFGLSYHMVRLCVKRKTWAHVK